jgi:hypothetical protein
MKVVTKMWPVLGFLNCTEISWPVLYNITACCLCGMKNWGVLYVENVSVHLHNKPSEKCQELSLTQKLKMMCFNHISYSVQPRRLQSLLHSCCL